MDAEKACEILLIYKAEHQGDMTSDELEAYDMALRELEGVASVEEYARLYGPEPIEGFTTIVGQNVEGEPERRARLIDLQEQGILP